jgi:small subunit ribosomal protein S6
LAYPIKHAIEGNYILLNFTMKPDQNRELETSLRISEDVLRHLLVKLS